MDRCGGYEAATEEEGPHEPQEMIIQKHHLLKNNKKINCKTFLKTPPAPLEHSDEEEGLEPWEVMLGHCGGYEATEGPYVLQEIITDEPPPPQPPLEPATAAEQGDKLEEQDLEPAAAAEHGDEDLEPWEIEPEQETGVRRYPEQMVPG